MKNKRQIATTIDCEIIKEMKHFAIVHNIYMNDIITLLWINYHKDLEQLIKNYSRGDS